MCKEWNWAQHKVQFCQDVIQFGSLQITPSGVTPSKSMIQAILKFSSPKDNYKHQIMVWAHQPDSLGVLIGSSHAAFQDLVKQNSKFTCNQSLGDAFKDSKWVIIDLVQKGVAMFDKDRVTCLAPDWSKGGMGFLLLQKHCQCTVEKTPIYCPEGWCLIFAGSRFCTDAEQ